jgi:hypothetical protein
MRKHRWSRRTRPTDPDPYTRLDWLDGLPERDPSGGLAAMAAPLREREIDLLRAALRATTGDPGLDRSAQEGIAVGIHGDPELERVFREETAPGMARDDLGTYAEPVTVHIEADTSEFRATMDRFASAVSMDMSAWDAPAEPVTVGEWTAPVPFVPAVEPMPREAFERIMADLHAVTRTLDAFDDGRAYEAGTRCRTEAAATKRADAYLADGGEDGARRAALVLAGYAGADMWAVGAA